jgi:hypothetical protein
VTSKQNANDTLSGDDGQARVLNGDHPTKDTAVNGNNRDFRPTPDEFVERREQNGKMNGHLHYRFLIPPEDTPFIKAAEEYINEANESDIDELRKLEFLVRSRLSQLRTPPGAEKKIVYRTLEKVMVGGRTFRLRTNKTGIPYWYEYYSEGGKQKAKFIGKDSDELRAQLGIPLKKTDE